MHGTSVLNVVLWCVQGFLALFFVAAGIPKITGRGVARWTGFADLPRALVLFIGAADLLGAAGLVLPMATGNLPWLTPLAAVGLAISVLMASGFHIRADERLPALETALWASILGVVAIGRWSLLSSRAHVPGWILIAALGVLVPAVIINLIVLFTRPLQDAGTGSTADRIPSHGTRASLRNA
jgi:DoxX-like protein